MFCGKCGTENNDVAKFCKKCGAPLMAPANTAPAAVVEDKAEDKVEEKTEEKVEEPKGGSALPKILAGLVAVAVLTVIAAVLVLNAKPTIDLNKYVVCEAEGYDGYGKPHVSIDWDGIDKKYGKKLKLTGEAKKELGELAAMFDPIEMVAECVSVEYDNSKNLSNGDVVEYTWDIDESLSSSVKCKLKYKDGKFKVSDLTELGKFDAFADLEVSFSGVAPQGRASLDYIGEELNYYDFEFDEISGLSNGDSFVVKIDDKQVERCAEQYGRVPESLEKEYTVSGLSSYVTKISEINDSALKDMQSQAEDAYYSHAAKSFGDGEEVVSLNYIGDYLLTSKGSGYGKYNYLYLIYKAEVHDFVSNKKQTYDKINDVYWFISYSDVMLDENGIVSVDLNDYNTPGNTFYVNTDVSTGWFGTKSWYYHGYESLDDLYKSVVTANLDAYNHEDNVDTSLAVSNHTEVEKPQTVTSGADYILPNSDSELISKSDLEGFDAQTCKLARNEIYARHGRKFKDSELQEYFDSKDWYKGTIDADDFQESILSDIEIKNKDVIVDYEKEKGYR